MRLHRVTWVDPDWAGLAPGDRFHPLYVPLDRQGGGRFDNPHRYAALYGSTTAQGAVGEAFGSYARWLPAEVTRTADGRPRCLVELEVPDDVQLVDLDDCQTLGDLGLRPSDVVRRDRDHTQEVALSVWLSMPNTYIRGFRWWSYWRPEWSVAVLWSDSTDPPWFPFAAVAGVEPLELDHPAVVLAAEVLPRELG